MKLRSSILVVLALSMITAGCATTVHMRYSSDMKKVIPVLRPGDTISWQVPVAWVFPDENPCEPGRFTATGGTECKIRRGVAPSTHSYDCDPATPCDPDIAVDDDFRNLLPVKRLMAPATAAAARAPDVSVYLRCLSGATDIRFPEMKPAVGETLQWRSTGSNTLNGWKVELQGANRDKLCAGGAYEFAQDHEACKVMALPTGGPSIEYTVTSTNCGAPPAPGKVTPQ